MTTATATAPNTSQPPHFLLVTFPSQGHINPALHFAKLVIRHGASVTYATAVSAHRRMVEPPAIDGLSFSWFSDGFDDGLKSFEDQKIYISELKRRGSKALNEIVVASVENGRPITCVVYSVLVPWGAEVARGCHLPSVLLWIEPATVLDIYYYYFKGDYANVFATETNDEPSSLIELPGLPPLASRDLPSFLQPSKIIPTALATLQEHIKALETETNPKILVNTFQTLEPNALKSIENFNMIPIGPLILPQSDLSSGADLFQTSEEDNYVQWLDSKPEKSVIYISLGTHDMLPKEHVEAISGGLIETGRPFMWVLREKPKEENEMTSSIKEKLMQQGIIVPWCSQMEVLSHQSIGCFVTHCGWNSTLESLVSGVPIVALPQFADQCTSARLVEDFWKIGVRVGGKEAVGSEEIKRCLEMVMNNGDEAEEIRRNAERWKEFAAEAAAERGPSDLNVESFVDEIGREPLNY